MRRAIASLHREDTHPRYLTGEPTVETDGGFAELMTELGDNLEAEDLRWASGFVVAF